MSVDDQAGRDPKSSRKPRGGPARAKKLVKKEAAKKEKDKKQTAERLEDILQLIDKGNIADSTDATQTIEAPLPDKPRRLPQRPKKAPKPPLVKTEQNDLSFMEELARSRAQLHTERKSRKAAEAELARVQSLLHDARRRLDQDGSNSDSEHAELLHRIEELAAEQQQRDELVEQLNASHQAELDETQDKLTSERRLRHKFVHEVGDLQEQLARARDELTHLQEELAQSRDELTVAVEGAKRLSAAKDELHAELRRVQQRLDQQTADAEQAYLGLADERDQQASQLDATVAAEKALDAEVATLKEQLQSLTDEVEAANTNATQQAIAWNEERAGFEQERNAFEQERAGFEQERDEIERERDGFERERDGFERERDGFEQERAAFEQDMVSTREALANSREELDNTRQELERSREERDQAREELSRLQAHLEQRSSELAGKSSELEAAVQQAESLKANSDELTAQIDGLKSEVTFERAQRTTAKEHSERELSGLRRQIETAFQDLQTSREGEAKAVAKVESLSSEVLEAERALVAADIARQQAESQTAAANAELGALRRQSTQGIEVSAAAQGQIAALKTQLEETQKELNDAYQQVGEWRLRLANADKQREDVEMQGDKLRQKLEALRETVQREAAARRKVEATQRLEGDDATSALQTAEARIERLSKELAASKNVEVALQRKAAQKVEKIKRELIATQERLAELETQPGAAANSPESDSDQASRWRS